MAGDEKGKDSFDLRRNSRGVEPPAKLGSWKRRIVGACTLVVVLVVVGGGAWIWYEFTHVGTITARVRAAVVELSGSVDARLLELNVSEKQTVRKGDVVARLDDTELRATLEAAEANRTIRESAHRQAQARERLTEVRIRADIDMAKANVAVAEARLNSLKTDIAVREKRLPHEIGQAAARQDRETANLELLQAGPRRETVEAAKARIASAQATLDLYKLEVEQSRQLVDEGIDSQHILEVRKTRLETQQNALKEAQLRLEELAAGPLPDEIRAAKKRLEEETANLAIVKLGSLDLESMRRLLEIRAAEVLEAKALLQQAEAREEEVTIAKQQTRAALAELQKAEAEVAGRKAALGGMGVVSPVDGTVIRVFSDVGEICRKGIPIVLVSDASKSRWIEGFVDEEDALLVDIGQPVSIRVPANSSTIVEGSVAEIGLHTQSLDLSAGAAAATTTRFGQPDRVWVKINPAEPLSPQTVTGTTARASIRIR